MPRGDVSQDPLVNRITDRCKTLLCRNYVAGGNYSIHTKWQQNRQNSIAFWIDPKASTLTCKHSDKPALLRKHIYLQR